MGNNTTHNTQIRDSILKDRIYYDNLGWLQISSELDILITGLLQKDAKLRYTVDHVLWSDWIPKFCFFFRFFFVFFFSVQRVKYKRQNTNTQNDRTNWTTQILPHIFHHWARGLHEIPFEVNKVLKQYWYFVFCILCFCVFVFCILCVLRFFFEGFFFGYMFCFYRITKTKKNTHTHTQIEKVEWV